MVVKEQVATGVVSSQSLVWEKGLLYSKPIEPEQVQVPVLIALETHRNVILFLAHKLLSAKQTKDRLDLLFY